MKASHFCGLIAVVAGIGGHATREADGTAGSTSWILWTVAIVSAFCAVVLVLDRR